MSFKKVKGHDSHICRECGVRLSTGNTKHVCENRTDTPVLPSIFVRAINLGEFTACMIMEGFTPCTREEIDSRYEFCSPLGKEPCVLFHHTVHACTDCGCYVNRQTYTEGLNMLAWKEKHCPLGHF